MKLAGTVHSQRLSGLTDDVDTQAQRMSHREQALLSAIVDRLGARAVEELTEGGSPARLLRVALPDGRPYVIKLLVDLPGAVDGHDLDSFRTKIRQIDKVRAELAPLRDVYTDRVHEFGDADWAAYTMPFYPTVDIAACLRGDQPSTGVFFDQLGAVLGALIRHGYARDEQRVTGGTVTGTHVDRLRRRFWLLRKYLPAELAGADHLVVNGRRCRHPAQNAELIRSRPDLLAAVEPGRLYYPAHGDLNTRNILVARGGQIPPDGLAGYRIIDPRGTLDHWDISYDLAKILFSLTVWDGGLRKGFEVNRSAGLAEATVGVRGGQYPGYLAAARAFPAFLDHHSEFSALRRNDPNWLNRLLLGHAFHLLAEAACRLSDIKKRTSEASAHDVSPLELALGHYLYGVVFLEDAVTQLATTGEIDPRTHLDLVPGQ
jgi:hypothetical protein